MCYVEAGAQTLNVATGTKAAVQATKVAISGSWAFGATAWAWAFAAMGTAGAAMSGVGAAQQFKWAGEVGTEIEMRRNTQNLNAETSDIYDERIDDYEGYVETVDDLELAIPDDMEAPEEVPEIPEGDGSETTNTGFGLGLNSTAKDNDKDKDENNKE